MVDKICAYIVKVGRLRQKMGNNMSDVVAMDETAMWKNTISDTTAEKQGANMIDLITTRHEKSKVINGLSNCDC